LERSKENTVMALLEKEGKVLLGIFWIEKAKYFCRSR